MKRDYMPADLAKLLHISVPTLRKYSLLVEKVTGNSNYFTRNQQNVRAYTAKDLSDLQQLVELSKERDMTLQSAAQKIFAGEKQAKIITSAAQLSGRNEVAQLWELCQRLKGEVLTTRQRLIKLEERVAELEARPAPTASRQSQTPQTATATTTRKPIAANSEPVTAPVDAFGAQRHATSDAAATTKHAMTPTHLTASTSATTADQHTTAPQSATKEQATATDDDTTDSGLKFTAPLPSDDPAAAQEATHHLVFGDEPKHVDDDHAQNYDQPHDLAAMQVPDNKEKKQSWWQRVRGK